MNNTVKRIVVLIVAIVLCLCLCGCVPEREHTCMKCKGAGVIYENVNYTYVKYVCPRCHGVGYLVY